jgi:NAD(P)H-flavin reductase
VRRSLLLPYRKRTAVVRPPFVRALSTTQVSKWLNEIPEGTAVPFKGPISKFTYQPNQWDAVGLIAGGSGITPMYQLIQVCIHAAHVASAL